MSTSSVNPLSTSLAITTPQTTTTGSSSFASDLQASVTRALQIASLPMQMLQVDQSTISSKTTELKQLGSLFGSLQTALQSISTGNSALQATVGDSSVVQASLTGSAISGTYTVQVLNAGSASSALSNATTPAVTDPTSQSISANSTYTLSVGGTSYPPITLTTNSLNALATAINSSGAPVQAVVINLGSPNSPDYRLSLQSTALGNVAIQLTSAGNGLMGTLNAGTSASYTVDGQPSGGSGITTNSSTVTIAPGLNVTLEKVGATSVTVASSLSTVSSQLAFFVNAYNAAFTELQKNVGQSGGALTGNSTVLGMEQALTQMINYSGASGSIKSLTQLGVEFTQQGTLTFNTATLTGLTQTQISDALSFLGDPNSGGFLQFANNTLNTVTDPISGSVATETQMLQNQNQQDQVQITNDQAKLATMQRNLQAQMAKANALIAQLQQQTTFLQGLFQYGTSNNPYATTTG
jgi:flagellar hook-associated protein 2